MKVKAKIDPNKLLVNGVELDFNSFNENDLARWQEVGAEVEKKYPDAMNVSAVSEKIAENPEDTVSIYRDATSAYTDLYKGVFGESSTHKLLGEKPYYGLCVNVYFAILAAVTKQGSLFGTGISDNFLQFMPVGEKGAQAKKS